MKTFRLKDYLERLKDPFSGINDFVFPDLIKNIVSPPLEALITPLEKLYEIEDKESKNVKVFPIEVENQYRKVMSLDFQDDKFIICFTLANEPTAFNLSLEKTMKDIFPDHQPSSREPGDIKELNVYRLPKLSSDKDIENIIKIDSSENQYSGQKCFSQRRSYSTGDHEWNQAKVDLNATGYGKWKEFFTAVSCAFDELGLSDVLKEQTNLISVRNRESIYTGDGLKQYRSSEELAYELLAESRYSLSEGSPIHAEFLKLTKWSMQEDLRYKFDDLETTRNYLSTQPSIEGIYRVIDALGAKEVLEIQGKIILAREYKLPTIDNNSTILEAEREFVQEVTQESGCILHTGLDGPIDVLNKLYQLSMEAQMSDSLKDIDFCIETLVDRGYQDGQAHETNDGRNSSYVVTTENPDIKIVCFDDQHHTTGVVKWRHEGVDKITIIPYSANENNVEALKDALMEFNVVDNKAKLTLFKFQDRYRERVWNALMGNINTVVYALNNDTLEKKY